MEGVDRPCRQPSAPPSSTKAGAPGRTIRGCPPLIDSRRDRRHPCRANDSASSSLGALRELKSGQTGRWHAGCTRRGQPYHLAGCGRSRRAVRGEELMSTERPPVTNIIFGTMTLSYRGYGSRVHDAETAGTMLNMYADAGYGALDTAHAYGGGTGEQMLGDLGAAQRFTIATRYDPQGANHAQERDELKAAFRVSLTRLKTDRVKILYLTTRDHTVPLESTLRGVQDLYEEGLFDEFGLSNFSVADIEDVLAITTREGWIRPTVYQGLYNALARIVETELFPTLAEHGMRFQAYNPL